MATVTPEGATLTAANAKFALAIYRYQAGATTGNVFMSPLSISVAMAMTYLGARNNTKSQMSETLHFGVVNEDQIHQAFSEIRHALTRPEKSFQLHIANRLFGEKSYNFLADFVCATDKYYGAKLEPVDFIYRRWSNFKEKLILRFSEILEPVNVTGLNDDDECGDSLGSTELISGWIADNTAQKITQLIEPGVLNSNTQLVLVNAIYFEGNWLEKLKFNVRDSNEDDFHVSVSETVRAELMYKSKVELSYGFNEDLSCQAIELPYEGDRLSMFVILPEKVGDLSRLESNLTTDDFLTADETFNMKRQNVRVWLPKFKLDEKLELTELLATMGMTDKFNGKLANFSDIDGTKKLHVSEVLHQAVIDVNEEGTEAAAATAVIMIRGCSIGSKPVPEFRADRPFLVFIRDNLTNSVLFVGRLARP